MPSKIGTIYFFELRSPQKEIKIGFSSNWTKRVTNIGHSVPYPIKMLGIIENKTMDDENALHLQFAHLNIKGEWYYNKRELKRFIKENTKVLEGWEHMKNWNSMKQYLLIKEEKMHKHLEKKYGK